MNTLRSYFERAQQRPPLFNEENIREMIEQHGRLSGAKDQSGQRLFRGRSRVLLMLDILFLTLALFIMVRSFTGGAEPAVQRAPYRPDAGSAMTHRIESPTSVARPAVTARPTVTAGSGSGAAHGDRSSGPSRAAGSASRHAMSMRRSDTSRNANVVVRLHDSASGLQPVDLTDAELARIGIRGDSDVVWFKTKQAGRKKVDIWGVGSNQSSILVPDEDFRLNGFGLVPSGLRRVTNARGKNLLSIFPREPNDSMEQADRQLQRDIEEALAKHYDSINVMMIVRHKAIERKMEAGELIPILVRSRKPNARPEDHWLAWFEVTPQLLKRLPKSVREKLTKEMMQAARITKERPEGSEASKPPVSAHEHAPMEGGGALGRTPSHNQPSVDSASRQVPGSLPYLDILRSSQGAIAETSLFPNPAFNRVAFSYSITSPRTVVVRLYDLTGNLIGTVAEAEAKGVGQYRVIVDLQGLGPGIYLVSIMTDHGEHAVQRLMVKL